GAGSGICSARHVAPTRGYAGSRTRGPAARAGHSALGTKGHARAAGIHQPDPEQLRASFGGRGARLLGYLPNPGAGAGCLESRRQTGPCRGMNTLMGVGGSQQLVKSLVANGFPVNVSQWVSLTDHYGHYRPIEGYDDAKGVFIASDPYLGPNHQISYDEFGKIWNTNNRFMVIFPTAKQPLLLAVLAANG